MNEEGVCGMDAATLRPHIVVRLAPLTNRFAILKHYRGYK